MAMNPTESREKLMADFSALACDAEDLLKATAGLSGESLSSARAKLTEGLRALRHDLVDSSMAERGRQAVRSADLYVRERPWPFIAGALLAGLLIGIGATASRR